MHVSRSNDFENGPVGQVEIQETLKKSFEGGRGCGGKKSLPPKTGGEEGQGGLLGLLLHQARYLSTTLQLRIFVNNLTIVIFAQTTDDIYRNLYTTGQA